MGDAALFIHRRLRQLPLGEESGDILQGPAVLVMEAELLTAILILQGCNRLVDQHFLDEGGGDVGRLA